MLLEAFRNMTTYIREVLAAWGFRDEPLKVRRVKANACIPTKGSSGAVGLDLYATEKATIEPCGYTIVPTGLAFTLPSGTYGRIASRTSLSVKGVFVRPDAIDPDYKGEVSVILFNFGTEPYECYAGQRVAQLILEKVTCSKVPRMEETWEL